MSKETKEEKEIENKKEREERTQRIERIRKLIMLAEWSGKGYSVYVTLHAQHDEEVTEEALQIVKGMNIEPHESDKFRWFNFDDAEDSEERVLAKLQVSLFYSGGKEEEAKWLKHFSDTSSEV